MFLRTSQQDTRLAVVYFRSPGYVIRLHSTIIKVVDSLSMINEILFIVTAVSLCCRHSNVVSRATSPTPSLPDCSLDQV